MTLNNLKSLSDLAKAAQSKKGKVVLTVNVEDVVCKNQVRKRFRNIEELAVTLLTEGQQSPIIVFPKNTDGKYVIQKGERRWRACKQANIETIDIIVNDKLQSDLDETAGELIENIQRDNLTSLEIAHAIQSFIDTGWKQKDIAKRIGKNISYVSTHLSLLKMPDCVRELDDNEVCSDTETLNNLRLLYELNADRCRAVCAVSRHDGITRKQSRELLNDAKRIKAEMENRFLPKEQQEHVQLPLSKNKEWKNIRPDTLTITVNVMVDDDIKRGVLMTDRMALVPETVSSNL
ncbi:ParB/RepB/Spo0J family partition protein [Candidatus Fukatsuia endosymbiont of Tuberolachnus salignus]|uniref:ParB/RepB/Spo0J family partition protein n=1 Tax=Candidatus Fukatsuia endosymbiont of Tuberolachnus salignus TaxID=3077957 RepID=UPI003CC7A184